MNIMGMTMIFIKKNNQGKENYWVKEQKLITTHPFIIDIKSLITYLAYKECNQSPEARMRKGF